MQKDFDDFHRTIAHRFGFASIRPPAGMLDTVNFEFRFELTDKQVQKQCSPSIFLYSENQNNELLYVGNT